MASTSVDKISKILENPTITLIGSKSTNVTIHSLHKLPNFNTASVSTNLGCRTLGNLCLSL